MAYRISTFDGVALPDFNTVDDLGTGDVESTLVDALNGTVDYYGSTRKLPRSQKIPFRGAYISERGHIVDERRRALTDNKGRRLLSTDQFFKDLQQKTDLLKSKVGILGRLYRQPEGARATALEANRAILDQIDIIYRTPTPDQAAIAALRGKLIDADLVGLQWKLSRLLSVKYQRELKDIDRVATLDIDFETAMSAWKSDKPNYISGTMTGVKEIPITISGSETVNDFVLTITPTAGSLTRVEVSVNGSIITWNSAARAGSESIPARPQSPPVAANTDLVADMGSETIIVNSKDAYANFETNTNLPGWLYFVPGINRMSIQATGAPIGYSIQYYNQWT